jgi:thermitase
MDLRLPFSSSWKPFTMAPNRFLPIALAMLVLIGGPLAQSGQADPGNQLHVPTTLPKAKVAPPAQDSDILLVMPAGGVEQEDWQESIKKINGTVVGTIGEGPMKVLKVKVEKGKFLETEKKLMQDHNFGAVQRNFTYQLNAAAQRPVNDPYFANEWHLGAINVVRAWEVSKGGPSILAVLDTGSNSRVRDLSGKCYTGFDAIKKVENGNDVQGHGTMVATTAAASTNNATATAAPARLSYIYPIRVGTPQGTVSEAAIIEGINRAGKMGLKIINISANASPPYSFANKQLHPALHMYMRWFHDDRGGLIFNSAGNNGAYDRAARVPYLIVVSAIGRDYSLARFSTYGTPTWFTAPGVGIYCSTRDDRVAAVDGTSFSSPLAASVAALIWGANPGLKNRDVENILIRTCYKANGQSWTPYYGYGLPNAEAAVKMATGR